MADMQDIRVGVRPGPVTGKRSRSTALLLTFLIGVLCTVGLVVAVLSVFNIHGTISWPAGRIDIGPTGDPHVVVQHDAQ